jgi:hypothetical protein
MQQVQKREMQERAKEKKKKYLEWVPTQQWHLPQRRKNLWHFLQELLEQKREHWVLEIAFLKWSTPIVAQIFWVKLWTKSNDMMIQRRERDTWMWRTPGAQLLGLERSAAATSRPYFSWRPRERRFRSYCSAVASAIIYNKSKLWSCIVIQRSPQQVMLFNVRNERWCLLNIKRQWICFWQVHCFVLLSGW